MATPVFINGELYYSEAEFLRAYQQEAESLKQQLAECERERDRWKDNYLRNDASEFAAVTKERDELVDALKQIAATSDPDAAIRAEIRWEIAESALAKLGADKTGEGS